MTQEDFERLRRRFGTDVARWPAPHRREGQRFLGAAGEPPTDADGALDDMVLEAAAAETDEVALARNVLARIDAGRRPVLSAGFRWAWTMPVAASGFAVLLVAAALGGYVAAGDSTDGLDDALLAFALGDGGMGGADILIDDAGGEEQL